MPAWLLGCCFFGEDSVRQSSLLEAEMSCAGKTGWFKILCASEKIFQCCAGKF